MDWDQPLALEQQPVDIPPQYQRPPRLGRAPWLALADVLEDRTASLSPPPVELSVYHPLQTTTPHRHPTPTPSSTGTSPSRFESAPTSPKISRPTSPTPRTSEPLGSSFSLRPEEKRIPSTSTAPISSGLSYLQSTGKSWGLPGQRHGSSGDETSRTEQSTAFRAQENPWPFTSPSTEENRSALLTPHPYPSDSSSMPIARFGIPPQGEGYSPFDQEPLTNKQPWSSPLLSRMAGKTMALQSRHVTSLEDTQLGTTYQDRYPTPRLYEGMGHTQEKEGVAS